MLNCFGLSDTSLQRDPEPFTHQVGRKCEIFTSRANSHPKVLQDGHTRATMYSPISIEPWALRFVESYWSLANLCLLTFQSWEKDLGIPAPKLAGRCKNPLFGRARATSLTSIWSELTKELSMRGAYDDSPRTAGQKKTSEQLSRHGRGAEDDDCGHPN